MDRVEEAKLETRLYEAGKRLELQPTSMNELLEALENAETYLFRVEQSPSESILNAMSPAKEALTMPYFMGHPDKDVKLLVINCLSQIIKVTAPKGPYPDNMMKEVLKLIVGSFQELGKMNSPSFQRRFTILRTVAEVNSCIPLLDLELNDTILDMFNHFFSVVSHNLYTEDVYDSMRTIMCCVLDQSDDISQELLSVLLINLRREMEDSSPAAHSLSLNVVIYSAKKLRPYLREKFSSNQAINCNCRYGYHEIVNEICTRNGTPEINANQDNELIRDEKKDYKKKKKKASTSLKPNRPRRNSARKNTVSEEHRIGGRSGENENLVGRKIKVWWPEDKQFYEGVVESYDPKSNRHDILYSDGDYEKLELSNERWDFIDQIQSE